MRFALVPWSNNELNNEIFYHIDASGNQIPTPSAAYLMYEEFRRLGHEINTYDLYDDWSKVDYFLLYSIDWIAAEEITKAGYGDRMVYCNAEPPTVCSLHTKEGYETLRQIFPYILTWNPDWVDGRQIFKRCIPYYYHFQPCHIPFAERKLITGISANKHSDYPDELYTVREQAYDYFEAHYPEQFEFYGVLWQGTNHPCYKGTVQSKAETFHHYRFALCFENTRTNRDYITEKIWDCLNAQIVPIYLGAANIRDYIPEECYIDYTRFASCAELADYILSIDEERYQGYLDAAERLLHSEVIEQFRGEQYAHDILAAVAHQHAFRMTAYGRRFLRSKATRERWNQRKIALRMRIKRLLAGNR